MVLTITIALLLSLYRIVIGRASRYLMIIPYYNVEELIPDKVSIIIPARNEEQNIGRCLDSLLDQTLPKTQIEIIVVDDGSGDSTSSIVRTYAEKNVRLLQLSDEVGGKKLALTKGIEIASHPLIVTTDADCIYPNNWLNTLLSYRAEQDAVFVAAPVKYAKENSFFEKFQSLDFLSLQGITAAAVSKQLFNMCNGANLLYSKEAFQKVKGFEGIDHIPTGDDMLLMEKMQAVFPGQIKYCFSKDAIVETLPAAGLRAFTQQRIRWASKSTSYLRWGLLFILIKTIFEYPFMIRTARFFGKQNLLPWFIIAQPFHILYIVLSASLSFFKRYEWKGRLTVGG